MAQEDLGSASDGLGKVWEKCLGGFLAEDKTYCGDSKKIVLPLDNPLNQFQKTGWAPELTKK